MAAEHLANVPPGRAVHLYVKSHALLDDADLIGGDQELAELGRDTKAALLRDDEKVAVGVVEACKSLEDGTNVAKCSGI